jgi:hypothetical protein
MHTTKCISEPSPESAWSSALSKYL